MFWAKKFFCGSKQTLKEHTKELLIGLKTLRSYYGFKLPFGEEFWDALFLAALFHDLGKASEPFQSKIEGRRPPYREVPHNFLSGALFNGKLLRKTFDKGLREALFYSVSFHHDRKLEDRKLEEDFESALRDLKSKEEALKDLVFSLLKEFGKGKFLGLFKVPELERAESVLGNLDRYYKLQRNYRELKKKFRGREKEAVILKGLLHRLDHSASAGVPVEEEPHRERIARLEEYLKRKRSKEKNFEFKGFKPFQLRGRELMDESVILEAPTGSGKTEFALNWLGDDKGFYTLPVRTAVNSMFYRLKEAFKTVGLLHGERAAYYLLGKSEERNKERDEEKEELSFSLKELNLSTQLAFPLTVSTADQLFSSVFKYPGFEKVYATLSYSKTIIDEPQGYTPETLAVIVRAVEEVKELGGKFCVMSATLYPFVKDRLKSIGFREVDTKELYETAPVKHRVEVLNCFNPNLLLRAVEEKRSVLIVVNTVKRAVELYRELKKENLPVRLLHSRFIQADRKRLESQIEKESQERLPVIWITTQVAEASLDVDFDLLITEVAPLDALIQRMGRVNRRGRLVSPEFANAIVLTENSDRKERVYSKSLVELALGGIERWDGKLVSELMKRELVKELYSRESLNLKAKAFLDQFEDNLNLLENGLQAENHSQAQEYFRKVITVPAIPESLFNEKEEEIISLIDLLKSRALPFEERLKVQLKLRGYAVNLYPYQIKSFINLHRGVIVAEGVKYDRELGALLEEEGDGGEFI